MPTVPDNHDAHDYAERIRERLPRRLQELREAAGFTKYGLARESGVSREYIGKLRIPRFLSRHSSATAWAYL
jgi:transcriptional regulator with XRE-family HTH domain